MSDIIQTNEDGYIIDCAAHGEIILDPIKLEPIHKNKSIFIHTKFYDVESLYDHIVYDYNNNILATIPHNRQSFTEQILQEINNKLNNESEIIIEIINLLKFPKKTHEYILFLEKDKRTIILGFEDYKINILILLSEDDINDLFNNYDYLLSSNVSEEDIKKAVSKNYQSLLFLDIARISFAIECEHIIKIALKNSYFALKYIPYKLMTEEIIKFAIRHDYKAFQFVPSEKMTDKIIRFAVKIDSYALEFLPYEKMTYEIIKCAV
jgi:hypothetical protein